MTRNGALITLGVLVILLPFSGLPSGFLTWLFVLFGIAITAIGASLRKAHLTSSVPTTATEVEKPIPVPEVSPTQPSQIS